MRKNNPRRWWRASPRNPTLILGTLGADTMRSCSRRCALGHLGAPNAPLGSPEVQLGRLLTFGRGHSSQTLIYFCLRSQISDEHPIRSAPVSTYASISAPN